MSSKVPRSIYGKSQSGFVIDNLKSIEGKMLTIADASFPDIQQREAVKSLMREPIWSKFERLMTDAFGRPDHDKFIETTIGSTGNKN